MEPEIPPITIEEEMKSSYLDYAMSVIVSRALPDVRDGLKPVHRRILYAMQESGFDANKPYRKSSRIVGDVMGKYHPHGDQSIYDAMVRMAQDFSMRLPLIDGQGNFGSMDGDPPAAMRYTESRLAWSAHALLDDIDKDTVDFMPNYDGQESEPVVLPARFPNLLVNGAGGIAVGMATNIPPHNLGEVIDGCCAYLDNPALTVDDLIQHIPGPDFPTGGIILGRSGIHSAYHTGRGSILMRGRTSVEEIRKDREAIIVHEIPYQVNKASMIEKIADAVRNKRIEGIAELRDESDRHGVRVVMELKRDAVADVVLNQLYRFSPLQGTFGANIVALNMGRPQTLDLKQMVEAFVQFREEVITRRTKFLLRKARERAHIVAGLVIAVANIDEVIKVIRGSASPAAAREELLARAWPAQDVAALVELISEPGHKVVDGKYHLSDRQARAILELRLNRLTALGMNELGDELSRLGEEIEGHLAVLRSREKLLGILRAELIEMKEKFATPRRTTIEEGGPDFDDEDLIQKEDMVVTVTQSGYVKRVPLSTYRAQRRGGKGRSGLSMRDEDMVTQVFVANTHTPLLVFTSDGIVFKIKVWRLPLGTPQARGKAFVNLLPINEGQHINTVMALPEDEGEWDTLYAVFATSSGKVRRNALSDFANVMSNGKIAIRLENEEDRLVGVAVADDESDILLASRDGKAIRFQVGEVRVFKSRTSEGVRGMNLGRGDHLVSMSILKHADVTIEERDAYLRKSGALRRAGEEGEADVPDVSDILSDDRYEELAFHEEFLLSVTENGYGKRTSAYEYRVSGRGGQGIINIETTRRNGRVVTTFPVGDKDQLMLVTDAGKLIRCPVFDIRIAGRGTQGVTIFKTADEEHVVSVARLAEESADDEEEMDEALEAGEAIESGEDGEDTTPEDGEA